MPSIWAKTRTTLEMIKWEHSIFALPFALDGGAAGGERTSRLADAGVDSGGHGGGALCCHGV